MIPRWILTLGHDSTLNTDPGSWFHVELWPQVLILRWIVTRGRDHISTWNSDPGSQFNVEFWPGVTIQRGIFTRGHNSTWNSDPSTYLLPVELRLNKVSKFNGAIKIQQLGRVIIQRKIHWIVTPGQYSIGGSKFYLTPEVFEIWMQKYPQITLKIMFSDMYILKIPGGGGGGSAPPL